MNQQTDTFDDDLRLHQLFSSARIRDQVFVPPDLLEPEYIMLLFFPVSLVCRKTERVIRLTQSAVEATFAIIPGEWCSKYGHNATGNDY